MEQGVPTNDADGAAGRIRAVPLGKDLIHAFRHGRYVDLNGDVSSLAPVH
jgi:hypothetical protein